MVAGTGLLTGRGASAVLGVRSVRAAVGCLTNRKGVLAVVLVVLAATASRGREVVTGGVGRTTERDILDIGGLGRVGLEFFCPSVVVLEKPGRCRLRVPTAGFRGGARVAAILSDTSAVDCRAA